MNLGIKVFWGFSSEFRIAKDTITWDSESYLNKLASSSALSMNVNRFKDFTVSDINFVINDPIGTYRAIFNANNMSGNKVEIRYEDPADDTLSILLAEFNITKFTLDEDIITIFASNKFGELNESLIPYDVFDQNRFQDLPEKTEGENIPYVFGQCRESASSPKSPLQNSVKCWRYNDSSPYKYMIGWTNHDLEPVSGTNEPTYAEDPDFVDRTGTCTLDTDTIDGTKYQIVTTTQKHDFLLITFNYTTADTRALIDDIGALFTEYTFDTSGITGMFDYDKRAFDRHSSSLTTPPNFGAISAVDRLVLTKDKTKIQVIKDICNSFGIDFSIDTATKTIIFSFLDFGNITSDKFYQQNELDYTSGIKYDNSRIINEVKATGGYEPSTGSFENEFILQDKNSVDDFGVIQQSNLERQWASRFRLDTSAFGLWRQRSDIAAKYFLMEKSVPWIELTVDIVISKGLLRSMFDIIEFSHPDAIDGGAATRFYQIRGIKYDFDNDKATFTLRDIEEFRNYIDSKLLIHSWVPDGSKQWLNWSVAGNQALGALSVGPAHDNTRAKFGNVSLLFNGSSEYLLQATTFFEHYDILQKTNFTAGVWIYGTNNSALEYIMTLRADADNRWLLSKTAGNQFNFRIRVGASNVISIVAGTFVVNTWQRVDIVKVGTAFGLYVNGVQVGYGTTAVTTSISGIFYIGQIGTGGNYYTGNMQEIIVTNDNFLGLAPVVGLTDSFTNPTKEFGNKGLRV